MRRIIPPSAAVLILGWLSLGAPTASARPYVVVRDDGSFQAFRTATGTLAQFNQSVMSLYQSGGAPLPNVISVWTAFDFDGNSTETIEVAQSNDVKGIGLDVIYGGDGTFSSAFPPLEAVLVHNNVLKIPERAAFHRAPATNYARYLFLLEFSHLWGPAIRVPGSTPDELIGFTFHWSFWLNSGGSPAGGNAWVDDGDGGFSTVARTPSEVAYSPLDLYLMGLADSSSVPPFSILENAVPPAAPLDPLWGGKFSARSFPDFDATPLRVMATLKSYTIDDVISANGARSPTAADSPKSWTLGIMLIVPMDAGATEIAAAEAAFDPVASTFAPGFSLATGGLGSLDLVTDDGATDGGLDAGLEDSGDGGTTDGGASADAGMPQADAGNPPSDGGASDVGLDAGTGGTPVSPPAGACSSGGASGFEGGWLALLVAALLLRRAAASHHARMLRPAWSRPRSDAGCRGG